jgi:Ca2+-binding RTX toxin-like protein
VITLAVDPTSVTEDGVTNLVYTFTRSGITTNPLIVNYTVGGTANGSDYSGATPGTGKTITFLAGASTATLTLDPAADNTFEEDETVILTLTSGADYTIGTPDPVTGTITNDDLPIVSLMVSPAAVLEDGSENLTYTFFRTGDASKALTVNYTIAGTADGSDYSGATPGTGKTITFLAGFSTATLVIDPSADTDFEADETISLTLVPSSDYTIGTTTAVTGTIANDDIAIVGSSSRDTLIGDAFDNILVGGPGADIITSGSGRDVLIYTSIRDAGDIVTDFTSGQDQFDLSSLFDNLSLGNLDYSTATTGGYLKFQTSGANTILQIDADGFGPGRTVNFLTVENLTVASLNNSANFIL